MFKSFHTKLFNALKQYKAQIIEILLSNRIDALESSKEDFGKQLNAIRKQINTVEVMLAEHHEYCDTVFAKSRSKRAKQTLTKTIKEPLTAEHPIRMNEETFKKEILTKPMKKLENETIIN